MERLDRVRPKIIALIAPAGFGKSTLARQLTGGLEATAVCDATGILDDLDLARRLVPALAVENPERTQALTQRELMLGDGGTSVAERVNVALEAWKLPTDGTTFVFENAEHIANCPSARDLFARLLGRRPEGRTIVICSRESLRVHLTRFAPPHEIMTLRAADLAFDRDEMLRIFEPFADEAITIDRIRQVSQGWPIAVFLLKRFANEGRIEKLLEKLDDIAFEELHDYLADQILASLDPLLIDGLFACASIPNATSTDLRLVISSEQTMRALVEFSKESPFLERSPDGIYTVHPLLTSLLLEHREERRSGLLSGLADAYIKVGDFQRAAELHLARGDRSAAANALGQHEVIQDHTPSMEYARVLSSLDRTLVQAYPRLWAVTALYRVFCVDTEELFDEAEALWRTLSPEATPLERYYILMFRLLFMSYIGLVEDAEEILERFSEEHEIPDEPKAPIHGYIASMRGILRARSGKLVQAERDLTFSLPFVQVQDIMLSRTLATLGSDIARVRGEFPVARQFVDRGLDAARRSGLPNFIALDVAEGAFGAWFAGEDMLYARYSGELDSLVSKNGVRGFAYFAAATRERDTEPVDADQLKWVVCGRLIAAANAKDSIQAIKHAKSALEAAEQYRSPFMESLAAIAVALFDDVSFDEMMARAAICAEACESPQLQSAVRAIAERRSQFGMLDAFVGRMQRDRVERIPMLAIELASGGVRSMGRDLALSEREQALLVALALRRETVARGRLADLLWPDLDEYAARNALSVCLHRLRQHLGNDEAILRSNDGYRLHDDVRVDLWDIDRMVGAIRSRPALGDSERALLSGVHAKLRAKRPSRMENWEWFEPVERHIGELRLEVAHRLASDALSHGDLRKALDLAHEMIAYDPCDEPAREIAISAYLQSGDRAAALRHYRQYRETLLAELQCEPSEAIAGLVGLSGKTA
ncbi:MAG TPA: BTAD domain-containing putative transcriptional regulator [Candidatus Baltobacteraceae bacterium]